MGPGIPIDPRIKQRRIELRRASGRRRLRLILVGMGVAATIGGALAVLHSPPLRVRHLEVLGASHVSTTEVARRAGIGARTPMVDLNPSRIELSLDRLPWISSAVVKRHWPGTVTVEIVERSAVAQARAANGSWAELDVTGEVLDVARARWPGLVTLVGFGSPGRPGTLLSAATAGLEVAASIPEQLRPQVLEVLRAPGGQTDLQLAGRVSVSLGPPTDVRAKMSALSTMLAQVGMRGVQVINLEVPDAPTLTRS